jgi:hypothetical protein
MSEIEEKRETILNFIRAWGVIKHPYGSNDAEGCLAMLSELGVVIKGDCLGASHPHLAAYYTVESLIDDIKEPPIIIDLGLSDYYDLFGGMFHRVSEKRRLVAIEREHQDLHRRMVRHIHLDGSYDDGCRS